MRFDAGKAWPHPVLRPPSYGDDYPRAEFEVEIIVERVRGSTAVEVNAVFELSDPGLLQLVADQAARYALLIKASRTHFRDLMHSDGKHINKVFPGGALSGRTEFIPFLVCTRDLAAFRADGWHPDFSGRFFDIAAGSVLAEDIPKDYWIDTADEAPFGSIFGHKPREDLANGRWEYEIEEDRIWIVMSNSDTERYRAARSRVNNEPEAQYLMNGLYLPALIAVLNEVDQNADDYRDSRWFSQLDQRLEDEGCQPLGSESANRLVDAQKVLDQPFLKMPLIVKGEA